MTPPDTIIVLSGGSVALQNGLTGVAGFRTTTYEDRDTFGTLGARVRVEAAAVIASRFPEAVILVTGKRGNETLSHAQIMAYELAGLGVAPERVFLEERSETTLEQLQESMHIAKKRGWKSACVISNEYHIPRIQAFCEQIVHPEISLTCVAAETVLTGVDPNFAARFAAIKRTDAYRERIASESKGVAAIRRGDYASALHADKRRNGE
jgi:uncharacterized SAM-binding protein YcdF (DUF218 family)